MTIRITNLEPLGMTVYDHFIQYDITADRTYFIPFSLIGNEQSRYDTYDHYLLRDKNDNEFIGSMNCIEDTIEHESGVWSTTSEGDRWTTQFRASGLRYTASMRKAQLETRARFTELYDSNEELRDGKILRLDEAGTRLSWTKDGMWARSYFQKWEFT
ncbi:MAG: hypothetical protein Q9221_002651 [Calogaya cf. arnoldii]